MSPNNSPRVGRRRRVLADESRNDEGWIGPRIFRGDSEEPAARYRPAALHAINAPIAEYFPLRTYWLLVWFLAGLIPIVGLLLLEAKRPTIRAALGLEAVGALDLSAPGSLLAWCSSSVCAIAVVVMLGIYSVRRHRRDDYRGRFTVWRWAIFVAVIAGIDATSRLHLLLQGICEFVIGTPVWGDGSIWWVGAWSLFLGGTVVRLMFEMASSRQAVGWAGCAMICFAWAALSKLQLTPGADHAGFSYAQAAAYMVGQHLLLFSLVLYAREVVLEAMGIVESPAARRAAAKSKDTVEAESKPRTRKKRTVKREATKTSQRDDREARTVSSDESEGHTSPSTRTTDEKPALRAVHGTEGVVEDSNRRLSKTEKRRLRKEQKRRKAA